MTVGFTIRSGWPALAVLAILAAPLTAAVAQESKPPQSKPPEQTEEDDKPTETPADDGDTDEEELPPKLEEMELPSFARLMKGPAFDWLVLKSERVIVVEPVRPRPGTLEAIAEKLKNPFRYKPENPPDNWRRLLGSLKVFLVDADDREEYMIFHREFTQIIYFEDLMLRRIDKLLEEENTTEAFEMLTALQRRAPQWDGIADRQHRLLFTEAAVHLKKQQPESALVVLEDLHDRVNSFSGLSRRLGEVADTLITTAEQNGDHRQVRHFLSRLERRIAGHSVVAKWTEKLNGQAAVLIAQAISAEQAGQFESGLDFAEQAARLWPNHPDLNAVYRRLADRFQRLRVGVIRQPHQRADRVPISAAEQRRRELTGLTLFEPDFLDGKIVRYRTRFFEDWEPTELGHSISFRLRQHRRGWEAHPEMTVGPLVREFSAKLNRQREHFDERFAGFVGAVHVRSPYALDVRFRSVPLRPEALFAFPFSSHAAKSESAAPQPFSGPFQMHRPDARHVIYRRTSAEPGDVPRRHLAEVVEVLYPSHDKAVQGLLRGEVSMLPHVQLWDVAALETRKQFFVNQYALPVTHLVQFHPKNKTLRNAALRRALVYALDRRRILKEHLLGRSADGELGRLTSAPFPTVGYAYDSQVQPHRYDIGLAAALAGAAKKESGGKLPELRLLCPPDPVVNAAARAMIAQWARIGVKVSLITDSPSPGPQDGADVPAWDLVYRKVSMREPAVELWPFLTLEERPTVEGLSYLPDWLRQELVSLERVGDWKNAQRILHDLHKQLWAEVFVLPLWEVADFTVFRKEIRGVPIRPMHTYQNIDRWIVQPWYPRDRT